MIEFSCCIDDTFEHLELFSLNDAQDAMPRTLIAYNDDRNE